MKVQINEKGEILNFARVGDLENSLFVDEFILPGKFFEVFIPKQFILEDNQVKYNKDFTDDSSETPTEQATEIDDKDLMISGLTIQAAQMHDNLEENNTALSTLMLQIAELQGGQANG